MKNLVNTLALSLALLSAAVPAAAQTTQRLTANKASEYGLVYTLPVTRLEVTVAAEKTETAPGEFYQYAVKYLNSKPILAPETTWRITEAVIRPVAAADPEEQYLVSFKGGAGTYMTLPDEGFPLSVNDDAYDPGMPSAALPKAVKAQPTILETPEASQAVTPEMIQSRSASKRAELAAQKIYELRTNRSEIISGQAESMPADGEAMKLALSRIDRQEEALTAMFNGTRKTSVEVRTYTVDIPADPSDAGRTVLARLSVSEGLVADDDLSGAPVYLTIIPGLQGKLPVNEKGETKTFPKGGVAYRIPGTATAQLTYDGSAIAEAEFDVAQYGVVFGLDPALFTSKKAPSYLHFNPLTGGVRELGTVSE